MNVRAWYGRAMRYVILCLAVWLTSCAHVPQSSRALSPAVTDATLPAEIAQIAMQVEHAPSREERLRLTGIGLPLSDRCVTLDPNNPRCYYYRALLTGRYYEAKVIGYQHGIKQMVADLTRVIQLEPDFDHAGAYRVLGQLYTQLPKTTIHPHDITRDLEGAQRYLTEAVARAPHHPENHLVLCELFVELNDRPAASDACEMAQRLAQRWPTPFERHQWSASVEKLKKRLVK